MLPRAAHKSDIPPQRREMVLGPRLVEGAKNCLSNLILLRRRSGRASVDATRRTGCRRCCLAPNRWNGAGGQYYKKKDDAETADHERFAFRYAHRISLLTQRWLLKACLYTSERARSVSIYRTTLS